MQDQQLRLILEAQNKASKEIDKMRQDVKKMSASINKDLESTKKTSSSGILSGFQSALKATGNGIVEFSKKIGSIAWKQIKVGAAAATAAIVALGTKGIMSASQLQSIQISMNGLTGSIEAGAKAMSIANTFAQNNPFQLPDVAQTTKSLLAMGMEVDKLGKTLDIVGGISIVTGADLGSLGTIFGRVYATGKVGLEEINQLTDNGVGIQKALEKQFNKTGAEIRKMATDGKISFADFEKAMSTMVDPKVVEQLNNTLPRQIDRLKGSIRQLSNAFVGFGVDSVNGAQMASNGLAQAVTTMTKTLADALRTDELKEEIGSLGLTFVPMIQNMTAAIQPLIDGLVAMAYPISTVLNILVSMGSTLLQTALPGFQTFMDALDQGLQPLLPVLTNMTKIIGEGLSNALKALAPAIQPLSQALAILAPVFGEVVAMAAQFAAELITALAPILPPIAQLLVAIVQPLINGLKPILPVIVEAVGQLAVAFGKVLSALAPLIPPLIEIAMTIIQKLLIPLLPQIITLIELFAEVLIIVLNAIAPILPQLASLVAVLADALAPILPTIVNAFILLLNALLPILDPLLQLVTLLLPPLISFLKMLISIVGLAIGIWTSLVQIFHTAVIPVIQVVTTVVGGVIKIFTSLASIVWDVVSKVYNWVADKIGGVTNVIKGLKDSIVNAISGFFNNMVDAGKNIIDGIVKGITNAKDAVINKIKDIAKGALDAIKNFFGIKSPSRVMAQMGDFMMQGLQRGIINTGKNVVKTAGQVSQSVANAFADPLSGSISVGTSGISMPAGYGSPYAGSSTAPVSQSTDNRKSVTQYITQEITNETDATTTARELYYQAKRG